MSLRRPVRGRDGITARWLASMIVATVVYVVVPDGIGAEVLYNAILAAATVAMVAGIRSHRPAQVRTWWILAAGVASLTVAELIWLVNDIRGVDPFPSPADGFDLAGRVVLLIGIASLFRNRNAVRDITAIVDALIAGIGSAAFGWLVLLRPSIDRVDLAMSDKVLAISYVATDAAIVAGLLLLSAGAPRRRRALQLLVLGSLVVAAGDAVWVPMQLTGRYVPGGPLDALWPIGFATIAAAALHPSMAMLTTERALQSTPSRMRLGVLGATAIAVPMMAVLTDVVGVAQSPADHLVVAVASVVVAALSSWRLWGLVRLTTDVVGEREAQRYRALARASNDVLAIVGRDHVVSWVSPSVERVLGWSPDVLAGHPLGSVLAGAEVGPALSELVEQLWTSEPGTMAGVETLVPHADGRAVEVQITAVNQTDEPEIAGIVLTVQEITERRRLEDELAHQSRHDRLTGLANRSHLVERVGSSLARLRADGETAAVFLLDLDDFKSVNEGLGPSVGDEVLMAVAERLRLVVRSGDAVARLGGDEFALLCTRVSALDAAATADRLRRALERPLMVAGSEVSVDASVGVRLLRAEDTPQMVLRDADIALYAAKSAGKARCEVFDPEMGEQVARRLTLRADLRGAWTRREMFVVFQPIVDMTTGQIAGAEALVRWTHPLFGTVPPVEFIPLAEETGTITTLGLDILRAACDQAAQWRASVPSFYVSVNVSPVQLVSVDFVDRVDAILRDSGLAPEALMLEITEGVLLDRFDEAVAVLEALRARHVRTAIDDFGTGYSSLAYMQQLPVDVLKIDRSFTLQLGPKQAASTIVPTIMDLAGVLDVDVVAEGVDDASQTTRLCELGCRLGQGYLYARPLPAASFGALFDTRLGPAAPSAIDASSERATDA